MTRSARADADDRKVWVADSFEGLPPPNPAQYPADTGGTAHTYDYLAVSLEQVKQNFSRYGLLDDQVQFLKGIPSPIKRIDWTGVYWMKEVGQ